MIRSTEAAGAFYEAYFPLMYIYFRRRTADSHTAEDLTAEAFERILAALERFEPGPDAERSTRVWVYRIASNVFKNSLRGRGREAARLEAWAAEWRPGGTDQGSVETSILLGGAVAKLDPADREVLGLRFWEDMTAPEIAAVLDCSQREVYTTLDRCVRELRRHYIGERQEQIHVEA